MKKMITYLTALTILAFALPARADYLDFVVYNSTTAAADAAIDTGKILTAGSESLTVVFKNSGSGARTGTVECWDPDKVTTIFRTTVAVAATSEATVNMGLGLTSLTAPTGATNLSMKPCHVIDVTAAAATGTMRTVIIDRRQRFAPVVSRQKQ